MAGFKPLLNWVLVMILISMMSSKDEGTMHDRRSVHYHHHRQALVPINHTDISQWLASVSSCMYAGQSR